MKTQLTRTGRPGSLRLSRTARGVRAALLASISAAALANAPAAFAQSCTETAPNEVTCTGVFTDDVINSVPLVNQVPGLSLILDDATTVDPAAGVNGLTAAWGGDVSVLSYADMNTDGADAIYVYGDATATLATYGDLYTYVSAAGANAIDVSAFGNTTLEVGGSVVATGDGYYDVTTASAASVIGDVYIYNGGDIAAYAYGAGYTATALQASAPTGDIVLVNEGSITATAEGTAVAVDLYSNSYIDVHNYGAIAAYGDLYSIAIDTSLGLSADYIHNAGTITGGIYTGAGDDYLYNAAGGEWNLAGYSDFGAGDDTVVNAGTINMDGASISLGGYGTVAGNLFHNTGDINLEGDNSIDVGVGGLASGSVFVNDGLLDFQDGAADDTLTVYGDFAGTGNIAVDVEGDAGVADMLYIDGDVAADARQTIDVDLLDLSAPIADVIPIVAVSGTSTADNFALGEVAFDEDDSFVALDFDLVADIDTTNATPDEFGLGIAVVGLTDTGTVAASIAPGVHSLLQTQVGTWRQRMGFIDSFADGGISLWARVFTDKTDFAPEFESDDIGPAGNFDWNQRNRGVEAGVDFSVTDGFSIGLLAARSEADIELDPGSAGADIEADTWGVYGTWLSQAGFYLDASYRWTKFDTELNSLAGLMEIEEGKAETFNVELGYAFGMDGGLKIEPQLQWTKTNVKDMDVLTTANGMTFRTDGADSSRGRAGVAVYKAIGDADGGWQVTPYAALSAVREFDGENTFLINDTLVGRTHREGTSALLELAVTARSGPLSIWGGVNWQDGGGIESSIGGQLGVRYTFGGASPAPAPVAVAAPVVPAKTCAELDDDADGVNNCDDRCPGSTAGQPVGADGCPVPAPAPEPVMEPKPYRG